MSKFTAILGIGGYWCPWFPYALASVHFCDEIIVVNAGYNLADPNPQECSIPLPEVTRTVDQFAGLGRVVEIQNPKSDRLRLGTQLDGNARDWFNSNGLNYTVAAQTAKERGADWLLKLDSDQVCYADCSRLKSDLAEQSLIAWIYEFSGDIWHLADPSPTSPYNDSLFTFTADERNFFNGNGCAQIHSTRRYCPDIHAAHLRYANPDDASEEEALRHFSERIRYGKWMNEGILVDASGDAQNRLKNPPAKLSHIPPPECTLLPRKALPEWAELTTRMRLPTLPLNSYQAEDSWVSAKAF